MELGRIEEEEYLEAFGDNLPIFQSCRDAINQVKNNDPAMIKLSFRSGDAEHFSELAWELLGRYVADNDHLADVDLADLFLTDAKMSFLFKNWTWDSSLKSLNIAANELGLDGIRSMVPLLKNSPRLDHLVIGGNRDMNTESFNLLINALHRSSLANLSVPNCNIDDIAALDRYELPHLRCLSLDNNDIKNIPSLEEHRNLLKLTLAGNKIGRGGCMSIAKLLQTGSSFLITLDLSSNNIGDEGAEILAASLENNTTLKYLQVADNKFQEVGCRAFLKLLNDVSSIERTYNSNHTLEYLNLPDFTNAKINEMKIHIDFALGINRYTEESFDAGRGKVVETQLKRESRRELSQLQCIDYSYSSIFAEIDPILLPNILPIVGGRHGQNEIYRMLLASVPDLASIVNRKAVLKQKIAENTSMMSAMAAENLQMEEELKSIESGEENQPEVVIGESKLCGRKRRRRSGNF